MPQLEPLSERQLADICILRQSSQQAEDALTQGIDKLHQTLSQSIAADAMGIGGYGDQMTSAIENLEALEGFVNQVIISQQPSS